MTPLSTNRYQGVDESTLPETHTCTHELSLRMVTAWRPWRPVARTGLGCRPGCQPLAMPAGSLPAAHANACHRALVPSLVLLVLCHVSYHALRAPRHLPDYRSREQLAVAEKGSYATILRVEVPDEVNKDCVTIYVKSRCKC